MNKSHSLLIISAALAVGGCSNSEGYKPQPVEAVKKSTVEAGKEAVLFPLKVGTQWNYESEVSLAIGTTKRDQNETVTFQVVDAKDEGGVTNAVISIKSPEKETDRTGWMLSSEGIFQTSARFTKQAFTPAQIIVKFPIKEGEHFKQTLTGPVTFGSPQEQEIESTVLGWQDVDTDMGRVSALAVQSISKYTAIQKDQKGVEHKIPIGVSSETWWAPNEGMVRLQQKTLGQGISIVQTLRLKSKTPQS